MYTPVCLHLPAELGSFLILSTRRMGYLISSRAAQRRRCTRTSGLLFWQITSLSRLVLRAVCVLAMWMAISMSSAFFLCAVVPGGLLSLSASARSIDALCALHVRPCAPAQSATETAAANHIRCGRDYTCVRPRSKEGIGCAISAAPCVCAGVPALCLIGAEPAARRRLDTPRGPRIPRHRHAHKPHFTTWAAAARRA